MSFVNAISPCSRRRKPPMSRSDQWDWWFGEDDLSVARVDDLAEWKEHPFDALECGKGLTLYRRNGEGQINQRDAAIILTASACYEAGELIHLWNAPAVVREYLQTCYPGLSEQAAVNMKQHWDKADLDRQNAAQLVKAAEAKCPKKLGFFARAATRAAAWAAAKDYAQAVAIYHHREAVVFAVGAALFATERATCGVLLKVAEAAVNAAGLLAAEEVDFIARNESPKPLPPSVAQALGRAAAWANIRARFSAMVDQLFTC